MTTAHRIATRPYCGTSTDIEHVFVFICLCECTAVVLASRNGDTRTLILFRTSLWRKCLVYFETSEIADPDRKSVCGDRSSAKVMPGAFDYESDIVFAGKVHTGLHMLCPGCIDDIGGITVGSAWKL